MGGLPILDDGAVNAGRAPKPPWLRVKAPGGDRYHALKRLLADRRLHTVCSSAACPNVGECWSAGTATFMIGGNECTRACRFCDVKTSGRPAPLDLDEPARVAEAAALMGLSHVVVTAVARDDVEDGGARHFARTIRAIRAALPAATIEVLVPDFAGREADVRTVLDADPAVFNHNLETVERLTPSIRSRAQYRRSLDVLAAAKRLRPDVLTKSGIMLGLGERDDEVRAAIGDLRAANVDLLTLGQYLQPSTDLAPVARYVPPEGFAALADHARGLGFRHVEAGPLVRSSYHAATPLAARAERP
jgi:lipoyl synthase